MSYKHTPTVPSCLWYLLKQLYPRTNLLIHRVSVLPSEVYVYKTEAPIPTETRFADPHPLFGSQTVHQSIHQQSVVSCHLY